MTDPLVTFDSVSKSFAGGPLVLDRVSLEITNGEFVSFIGPSGCGKSTLLRLIAGLSPISSGRLRVLRDASEIAPGEIGFVFQDSTLLPWLPVRKNIDLPLKLLGVPPVERRARTETALRQVRLMEKAEAYPRQLSGGQKMRVSIARALSLRPSLLLLDEPFGALDEMTRDHLNEELLAIREEQRWTACFVTHSVSEAVFLSSRIIVLSANPGRIHQDFTIPLTYPRTMETRQSDAFHHLVNAVSHSLRSVEDLSAAYP